MIKGLVLAGSFREYVVWLQENEYNRSDYTYIGGDDGFDIALKTDQDTPISLVGRFRSRNETLKLVRAKFTKFTMDTVNLGFNANPDKHREPQEEEAYESD